MVNLAAVDKRQLSQGLQHLVSRAEKKHNMDYNPASPWSPLFCESSKPSLWVPFLAFLFFLGHLLAARRSCQVPSPSDQSCAQQGCWYQFSGLLGCVRRVMNPPAAAGWRAVNAQSCVATRHRTWTSVEIKVLT